MAKEVIWALHAVQDRDSIYQFWEHHNQSAFYSEKLDLLTNSETIEIIRVWDSHQNPDALKIF